MFHVAAELSRRGWIAMPTIRNTEGIDIIAVKNDRTGNIQVKTNSYGKARFPMGVKNESLVGDDIFYVLVTLKKNEFQRPDFYIVHSEFIAEYIKQAHKLFVELPPKRIPKRHQDKSPEDLKEVREKNPMRLFPVFRTDMLEKMPERFRNFRMENYRDKWEILES